MRCPKCGVEYELNSDKCRNCGNPKNPLTENFKNQNISNLEDSRIKKSYLLSKLMGLIGVIIFPPLAIAAGIYLVTRKEKGARIWGIAFLIIGAGLWIMVAVMVNTMGYDKFISTYNLTNYSSNFSNYGFKT